MAISKVILNGVTQMDVTDTTATAEDVANGKVFYIASGLRTVGTASCGLTDDVKTALLNCFEHVAWIDDQGQTYYDELYNALHDGLDSISAIYTQTGTVYTTDSLDILRSDLEVTATYGDNTTRAVTGYALSGTLTAGTSTITVTYQSKTATFSVVVINASSLLYSWDFTTSLVDSVSGKTAELRASTGVANPTRDSQGVHFNAAGQALLLFDTDKPLTDFKNKTIQIDVASFIPQSENNGFHCRFLMVWRPTFYWDCGMVFRQAASPNLGWNIYGSGGRWGSASAWGPLTDRAAISGHTVSLYLDNNLVPTLYIDSVLKGTQTIGFDNTYSGLTVGNINPNPAAQGGTFYDALVTGCRIYDGDVIADSVGEA